MKSVAEKSLDITSLFEAELLVRLMLEKWNHPLMDDKEFATALLEDAAIALRDACAGQQLIEDMPPLSLNFVAAVWYAEQCALAAGGSEPEEFAGRTAWLEAIRRSLPSCFCDPSNLSE